MPRKLWLRDVILWLVAGEVAFYLAMGSIAAVRVHGSYIPTDADSFYHAQRIMAAVASPTHLFQFDPQQHAPEGGWVSWPWGYDMGMAFIGHLATTFWGVANPMSVLIYVAPLWTLVNAALLLGITRKLGLSYPARCIAMLCYAASPLTQGLHSVGMMDHHYIEYTFVLGTVLLGLHWFEHLESPRRGAALGAWLGIAPAFHVGLFILQLPILVTLAFRWLLGRPDARRGIVAFSLVLLISTLLILLPSEPFRRLMFSFGLLSCFHLYIAFCTGVIACQFGMLPRTRASFLVILLTAVLMASLIVGQIDRGGEFLTGKFVTLSTMAEVKGIFSFIREGQGGELTQLYSGLIWLVPISLCGLLARLRYRASDSALYFAVVAVAGASLMTQQYRLENYGSFVLYLPLCCLADWAVEQRPARSRLVWGALVLVVAMSYWPTRAQLFGESYAGGAIEYEMMEPLFPVMARACGEHPGAMLADNNYGHFITFHTKCSVIADNFIMSRQDERKLMEDEQLMTSPLAEVLAQAPYVRYILAVREDPVFHSTCGSGCPENQGLAAELLFTDGPYPPSLKLLGEARLPRGHSKGQPFARLFEVVPRPPLSVAPTEPAAGAS